MPQGTLYDGQTANARAVDIEATTEELILTDGDWGGRALGKDLVLLERRGGRVRLGNIRTEGWRLVLTEPIDPDVERLIPRRRGALTSPAGRRTIAIMIGLMALVSVVALTLVVAPDLLAKRLPMSWERKIGAAYDLPASFVRCPDNAGQAALNTLIDRLDPTARKDGFTIELLDVDAVNAAALPGGRMVVFNGLVDDAGGAKGMDALAGVLAHEIAHVRRRHVATAMVRELGLGAVVTAAGGGAIASNAGGLLSLRYGRAAEAEADRDAVATLHRAGIDPRPTARLFSKFAKDEGSLPEWIASHPASGGRSANFTSSFQHGRIYAPAIDGKSAEAIATACDR